MKFTSKSAQLLKSVTTQSEVVWSSETGWTEESAVTAAEFAAWLEEFASFQWKAEMKAKFMAQAAALKAAA
jgi:glucose-6-phosphate isomerase